MGNKLIDKIICFGLGFSFNKEFNAQEKYKWILKKFLIASHKIGSYKVCKSTLIYQLWQIVVAQNNLTFYIVFRDSVKNFN